MTHRTLQFCGRWELRVNSLWLWGYAAFVLVAQAFLIHRGVERCRSYNRLSWPADDKPVAELYAYICLIVVSAVCLPVIALCSLFKIGCYSNDGTRLGRDNVLHHLNVESTPEGSGQVRARRFLRDFWRHVTPASHLLHALAAVTLLLPMSLVDAQKIKFGFVKPGENFHVVLLSSALRPSIVNCKHVS